MWKKVSAGIFLAFVLVSQISYFPPRAGSGGGGGTGNVTAQTVTLSGNEARISAGSARIGNTTVTLSSICGATPSAGTGTMFFYVSSAGVYTVGHNVTATITTGSCAIASGVSAFPADSYPIASVAVASGVSGAITAEAPIGRDVIVAGSGLSESTSGGVKTLSWSGTAPNPVSYRAGLESALTCAGGNQTLISYTFPSSVGFAAGDVIEYDGYFDSGATTGSVSMIVGLWGSSGAFDFADGGYGLTVLPSNEIYSVRGTAQFVTTTSMRSQITLNRLGGLATTIRTLKPTLTTLGSTPELRFQVSGCSTGTINGSISIRVTKAGSL